jgi:hypothetical protein
MSRTARRRARLPVARVAVVLTRASSRTLGVLLQLTWLCVAGTARADGSMMAGDRTLFRRGAEEPDYCSTPGAECDVIKTKVLSGYGYLRGRVLGGLTTPSSEAERVAGLGALRIATVSAALPGADVTLLEFDAVIADARSRLRVSLVDGEAMFLCRDARDGTLVAPLLGMMSRPCSPDASAAIDIGLLDVQWDVGDDRLAAEWLRAGFAWELLGNGFAHAHLLRSIVLALPVDLRTVRHAELAGASGTSLGAGLRLAALYRTPHWEWRLRVRYRTALIGGAGPLHDNTVEAETHALHNFFLTDAIVVQAGVTLAVSYAQRAAESFALWARSDQRGSGFVGLYLGWVGEPAAI